MLVRAAITLGTGPHSSFRLYLPEPSTLSIIIIIMFA